MRMNKNALVGLIRKETETMDHFEEQSKPRYMTEYEKERLTESLEQVDFDGDNNVEKVEEEIPEESLEEEKDEY